MPRCEHCDMETPADKLQEDANRQLSCGICVTANPPVEVLPAGTLMGREFDYSISYSRKDGIKASASLGRASLTLHVPQEELIKVIG